MDFWTILTIFRFIIYFPKCCPHRSSNVEESLCMWSWIKTDNITKKRMHALVKHLRGNAWLDFKAKIRLLPQKSNKHVLKFNCFHKEKKVSDCKQKQIGRRNTVFQIPKDVWNTNKNGAKNGTEVIKRKTIQLIPERKVYKKNTCFYYDARIKFNTKDSDAGPDAVNCKVICFVRELFFDGRWIWTNDSLKASIFIALSMCVLGTHAAPAWKDIYHRKLCNGKNV